MSTSSSGTKRSNRDEKQLTENTVVPLGVFDDSLFIRNFFIHCTLYFEGVLDPSKLRTSLEQLIELDGWRKAGARLRQNVRGIWSIFMGIWLLMKGL